MELRWNPLPPHPPPPVVHATDDPSHAIRGLSSESEEAGVVAGSRNHVYFWGSLAHSAHIYNIQHCFKNWKHCLASIRHFASGQLQFLKNSYTLPLDDLTYYPPPPHPSSVQNGDCAQGRK